MSTNIVTTVIEGHHSQRNGTTVPSSSKLVSFSKVIPLFGADKAESWLATVVCYTLTKCTPKLLTRSFTTSVGFLSCYASLPPCNLFDKFIHIELNQVENSSIDS